MQLCELARFTIWGLDPRYILWSMAGPKTGVIFFVVGDHQRVVLHYAPIFVPVRQSICNLTVQASLVLFVLLTKEQSTFSPLASGMYFNIPTAVTGRSMVNFLLNTSSLFLSDTIRLSNLSWAPVTLLRGKDQQSVSHAGLFPCGEGAGFAGGIVSAALDGVRTGRAVVNDLIENKKLTIHVNWGLENST